jgi:hypothetical protein
MSRINRRAAKPALFETHGCDPVGNFAARFLSAAFGKNKVLFRFDLPKLACLVLQPLRTFYLSIQFNCVAAL